MRSKHQKPRRPDELNAQGHLMAEIADRIEDAGIHLEEGDTDQAARELQDLGEYIRTCVFP